VVKKDYIIVGQGIAGTLLAWQLQKRGKIFLIIDERNGSSASRVAAGIIHPVTGRRIVKTWMADTLIPFARSSYQEIEKYFNATLFHPTPVIELLYSVKEYNDWLARSEDSELSAYIETGNTNSSFKEYLNPYFKSVLIKQSAWIDTGSMLNVFRKQFISEDILLEEKFDLSQMKLKDEGVEYKGISATKIIFCEGADAINNPFWNQLPFIPAKGEVITVKADMSLDCILNRKIFILPLGNNLFKVGSTYVWNFENNLPTVQAKEFLTTQLKAILKVPFEVTDHQSGIRPSVKNRRPFLGLHRQHPQLAIFNGLGTKGCLLAPYFAAHLAGFLSGENELMKEVDVTALQK
jgi:glycine oxidase